MQKTTRISIDFPYEGHIYLKMLCAKKGISIRQYIIDTVLKNIKEENTIVDDSELKKAIDILMEEKNDLWKKLADR